MVNGHLLRSFVLTLAAIVEVCLISLEGMNKLCHCLLADSLVTKVEFTGYFHLHGESGETEGDECGEQSQSLASFPSIQHPLLTGPTQRF